MPEPFILAIDQGTTNTKAILVGPSGEVVLRASCPLETTFPRSAWVEQDPLAVWRSVQQVVDTCLDAARGQRPAALAVTNQRETVLAWDRRTSEPLSPCVIWQCRRSAPLCELLRTQGMESFIRERTGLPIDPLFSASKMRWILDHIPNGRERAENGEVCIGTVDSWLMWNLTGGAAHTTDFSNAARTQLLDIGAGQWDADLCDVFGVPIQALPTLRPSSGYFGETAPIGHLPGGVPIASAIGDSHAALFGQAGFLPGTIKATYGTGSSLMTRIDRVQASQNGLCTTIAWARDRIHYALEGNIAVTGSAVQWLGEFLGAEEPSALVAGLADSVQDSEGVYVVPAFVGLGAPYWDEKARGTITGLTRSSRAAHVARAVIESIAFQIRDVFDAMQADAGTHFDTLLADGGATRNDRLMQFQADITGVNVARSTSADVSALGAVYLAGLAQGMWRSEDEIARLPRPRDCFEPRMSAADRERCYAGWKEAVAQAQAHR